MSEMSNEFLLKDGTKIKIRKSRPSDALAMNRTFNRSISKKEYVHRLTPSSLKETKEYLKKKGELIFVAYSGKAYAGSTSLRFKQQREKHMAEFGILIDEKFRGRGLGKLMMHETIKYAKKKGGLKFIVLHVYEPNKRAIALYRKMGFKQAAHLKDWLLDSNGKMMGEYIMRLNL